MSKENLDYTFELDLISFGQKIPLEAFGQIAKMYEKLISLYQQALYNFLLIGKLEYKLIGHTGRPWYIPSLLSAANIMATPTNG